MFEFTKRQPSDFETVWRSTSKDGFNCAWAGSFRIVLTSPKIHWMHPQFANAQICPQGLESEISAVKNQLVQAWTFDDWSYDQTSFYEWLDSNAAPTGISNLFFSYLVTEHALYHAEINMEWKEVTVTVYNRGFITSDPLATKIITQIGMEQDNLSFARDICKLLACQYEDSYLYSLYVKLKSTAMALDELVPSRKKQPAPKAVSVKKKTEVKDSSFEIEVTPHEAAVIRCAMQFIYKGPFCPNDRKAAARLSRRIEQHLGGKEG